MRSAKEEEAPKTIAEVEEDIIKYLVEPYDADLFVHTWDIESGGGRAANRFKAVSDNWKTQDEKISFFTSI